MNSSIPPQENHYETLLCLKYGRLYGVISPDAYRIREGGTTGKALITWTLTASPEGSSMLDPSGLFYSGAFNKVFRSGGLILGRTRMIIGDLGFANHFEGRKRSTRPDHPIRRFQFAGLPPPTSCRDGSFNRSVSTLNRHIYPCRAIWIQQSSQLEIFIVCYA